MNINVQVENRTLELTTQELSLAAGANARQALFPEFMNIISTKLVYGHVTTLRVHESIITRMIAKYSEQLVFQPLREIQLWLAYSSGAFIEPGYPPLFYSRSKSHTVSPNKSAIAAVGEGMAGLLSQWLYHCRKLARPNHDYPDIVMEANRTTYLVESKATLSLFGGSGGIKNRLDDELPRMATFVSTCNHIDTRPVRGLLIGTDIASDYHYNCYITEINQI